MSGWVTVTGPPFAICRRKVGTTEPAEFKTLPKRTATKRVVTSGRRPNVSTTHSHRSLHWPMTVCRLTALSVEICTKRSTPNSTATSATMRVVSALFTTAAIGFTSMSGTCL
jgi:hypothetical protein